MSNSTISSNRSTPPPAPWDLEAQSEEQAPLLASSTSISSGHISDTTGGQREERSALGRLERRPFYGSIGGMNLPRGNQSRGPITTALAPALSAPQRTEALLASLERERQIVRTIEQDIKKLHYADTISLVMSLDFNQMGEDEFSGEVGTLGSLNRAYNFPEAPFVLNKNDGERTPFEMNLLPLEGEEGVQPYPITPPLALKNLQGSRRGESPTRASNSDPTAAENRIIRAHLRGALEAYYGEEQLSHCPAAANLLDPAHQEEPIRHRDLYSIIDALGAPSVKGELKRLREQYRVLSPQELENLQQLLLPSLYADALDAKREAQRALATAAHHTLDHPEEALTQFFYHSAQTAARGGGVLLGAAAASPLGGIIIPSVATGVTVGTVVGALVNVLVLEGTAREGDDVNISQSLADGAFAGGMISSFGSLTGTLFGNIMNITELGNPFYDTTGSIIFGMLGGFIVSTLSIHILMRSEEPVLDPERNIFSLFLGGLTGSMIGGGLGSMLGGVLFDALGGFHHVSNAMVHAVGGTVGLGGSVAGGATAAYLRNYLAPDESLRRARAALNDLSGQSAQEALSTLQEAQAKDEETLAALRTMVEQQRGELSLHQLSPLEPPPLAAGEKIRAPRASVSNLSSASPNALEREDSGEIKFPEEEVLPATSSPESKREAVVRGSSQLGDSIISLLEAQCHYRAELIRTLAQKIKGEERRKELFLERIRPVIRGL